MSDAAPPWYSDGLRFACRGCGSCCRVEGYVWVDQRAIRRLAKHLDLSLDDFGRRYLRRVGRRYSLVERPNHDCVFWDEGCTVYEARPKQCRTFPFWPEILAGAESWEQAAATCRGMNQGPRFGREDVEKLARGSGATPDGPSGGCGCGSRPG